MFYGKQGPGYKEALYQAMATLHEMFGRVYAQDNLIALRRNTGFLSDPKFRSVFDKHATSELAKSLAWRLHTITWAGQHCLNVPGDFVECGVFQGYSMIVLADYLQFETVNKSLYLYDTFDGIPDEMNSENRMNKAAERVNAQGPDTMFNEVRVRFAKFPNVKIIRGAVPRSFEQECPEKVAFLHMDMNSAASEIGALNVLFNRISPGGMIVFDDYGWSDYVKQKIAEDEFMAARNHQILELPTGQGLLVKQL